MPTYEYSCKACGEHLEVVQSFKDSALTECPACKGQLRKVFGNIGVSFKGSGFYKTDSRSESRKGSSKGSEGKGSEGKPAEAGGAGTKTADTASTPKADGASPKADGGSSKADGASKGSGTKDSGRGASPAVAAAS